ncbi:MAG: transcriptional repressor [Microbacterium sp.]
MAQRNTWQRERVREELITARGFVSAQTLYARLREADTGIGLATVYRALSSLTVDGSADSLQSPEGENLFRACESAHHHHHLICRNCGLTVEIEASEVEAWAQRTATRHGFTQAEHVVDIFGLCTPCAKAQA